MFMDESLETINTMLNAINIGRHPNPLVGGSALKDMIHQAEWVIYHSAFEHNNEQVAHHAMAHGSALCVRFKQNHERCWNCVMGSSDSKMCQRVKRCRMFKFKPKLHPQVLHQSEVSSLGGQAKWTWTNERRETIGCQFHVDHFYHI